MPIEIRELVIKAVVDEGAPSATSETETDSDGKKDQRVVRESVEQVMEILERKKER